MIWFSYCSRFWGVALKTMMVFLSITLKNRSFWSISVSSTRWKGRPRRSMEIV